jgi:hypothetical protein
MVISMGKWWGYKWGNGGELNKKAPCFRFFWQHHHEKTVANVMKL